MNLSYGQDDRVCAFTSLFAMLDVTEAKKTGCCLLVDKEEIGSVGATGMHSRFFENTVAELIAVTEGESELKVRRALSNSKMLSSDVSAAFDPMFAEAFEKRSSAFLQMELRLINLQAAEENQVLTMQTANILRLFAERWTRRRWHTSLRSLEESTLAEAERSLILWPIMEWK